jgi:hypothetical protein
VLVKEPPPTQEQQCLQCTKRNYKSSRHSFDTDPEINFVNWELNIQDVAANAMRTISGEQGLLSLVLNQSQWDTHALNISTNDQGLKVMRPCIRGTRSKDVGHGDYHRQIA